MLHVKLKKALYGTLQAALLFWRLLLDTLIEWGFRLDEYDKCVANKTINRKQFFYVINRRARKQDKILKNKNKRYE